MADFIEIDSKFLQDAASAAFIFSTEPGKWIFSLPLGALTLAEAEEEASGLLSASKVLHHVSRDRICSDLGDDYRITTRWENVTCKLCRLEQPLERGPVDDEYWSKGCGVGVLERDQESAGSCRHENTGTVAKVTTCFDCGATWGKSDLYEQDFEFAIRTNCVINNVSYLSNNVPWNFEKAYRYIIWCDHLVALRMDRLLALP